MASNSHTIVICTEALRTDTNNMWRGLADSLGQPFDASPPDSLPGVMSSPLAPAATIAVSPTPWDVAPTHWMASNWDLPSFEQLLITLKAGNIPSRNWAPFNLNQNRARTAGQALFSRTQEWDPNGTTQTYEVVAQNLAASLAAHPDGPLTRIPMRPIGA